jgi:lysophospholipase L1-like esterase
MTFCIRTLFFGFFVWSAFGQANGTFSISMEPAAVSVPAGASVTAVLRVTASNGYSQPIYLIPGALPAGISLVLPSPVIGNQEVKLQVRAAANVKQQTYSVTVYAAGGGENHSTTFSVIVLPEGMPISAPDPAMSQPTESPTIDLPADPPPPLGTSWVGSWGASAVTPSNESGAYYLTNVTVRQIAHLSIGTRTGLRLKLSNALGTDPVTFAAVHIAQWAGDSKNVTSAIMPSTDRVVTFAGSATVIIPGGTEVLSDPIPFPLATGADVAVSVYIPRTSNVPATMHTFGDQTAYFSLGDATSSTTMPNAATDTVRPYLTGIDVDAPGASAVVALGDSLTDGMLSSRDQNLRWTDDLARRLTAVGVVNAGIAGNCMVMNCMGPTISERFKRDVLAVSEVKYLILQAGVNDIGNVPTLTPGQLTDEYRNLVALAHAHNILVYGATIPPFGGSNYFTAPHEKLRQQVNAFIRTGGIFDNVIDFDKALADPENPAYLRADYNGDKIRPNDTGYQAMANAIDLGLLKP